MQKVKFLSISNASPDKMFKLQCMYASFLKAAILFRKKWGVQSHVAKSPKHEK